MSLSPGVTLTPKAVKDLLDVQASLHLEMTALAACANRALDHDAELLAGDLRAVRGRLERLTHAIERIVHGGVP